MNSVSLRLTLSGPPNRNSNQQLLIDNLQINATAVPEASALAMVLVATLLLVAVRRRSHSLAIVS